MTDDEILARAVEIKKSRAAEHPYLVDFERSHLVSIIFYYYVGDRMECASMSVPKKSVRHLVESNYGGVLRAGVYEGPYIQAGSICTEVTRDGDSIAV